MCESQIKKKNVQMNVVIWGCVAWWHIASKNIDNSFIKAMDYSLSKDVVS